MTTPPIIRWGPGEACVDETWEAAYRRFETPAEEIRKFEARLRRAGVDRWPRSARIAELFCGRGNGLVALERLGFRDLAGVDLSEALLREYRGPAQLYVGDCRDLRFEPGSLDGVTIHGGLHHLPGLAPDLAAVVRGAHAALRPGTGRLVVHEPWPTPYLRAALLGCRVPIARRLWPRLDAWAVMVEREGETFGRWLARPGLILSLIERAFRAERLEIAGGALLFVGVRRDVPAR
jgi:hypothetical protein